VQGETQVFVQQRAAFGVKLRTFRIQHMLSVDLGFGMRVDPAHGEVIQRAIQRFGKMGRRVRRREVYRLKRLGGSNPPLSRSQSEQNAAADLKTLDFRALSEFLVATGRIQRTASIVLFPVCGELLILGKSVIRHTQHPEGAIDLRSVKRFNKQVRSFSYR